MLEKPYFLGRVRVSRVSNSHTFSIVFVPTNIKKHHEEWFLRDDKQKNNKIEMKEPF